MSDGMAFLTGAAFAGVAVLFMMKGGDSLVANNLPPANQLPISQANPYNPYVTTPPMPTPTVSSSPVFGLEQQVDAERLRAMFEQQRTETEQLKAQLQKQQLIIENLTNPTDPTARNSWSKTAPGVSPAQPQENSILTGVVWALGGMAITISGGIVVVGALALLSRQQRPPRTTYVVQHPYQPYNALPPTLSSRRRAEVMPPQLDERRVDYVEYDR
mgnify:CR=1 FL=1